MRKTIKIHCQYARDLTALLKFSNNINFKNLEVIKIIKPNFWSAKITVEGAEEKIVEFIKAITMQDGHFTIK